MYYLPVVSSVPIVLYITYEKWPITESLSNECSQFGSVHFILTLLSMQPQSQCHIHQDLIAGSIKAVQYIINVEISQYNVA